MLFYTCTDMTQFNVQFYLTIIEQPVIADVENHQMCKCRLIRKEFGCLSSLTLKLSKLVNKRQTFTSLAVCLVLSFQIVLNRKVIINKYFTFFLNVAGSFNKAIFV